MPAKEDVLFLNLFSTKEEVEKFNSQALHVTDIYRMKTIQFSVFFDFADANASFPLDILKNKDAFLRFFFHPNFKKIENKPLVFFTVPASDPRFISEFMSSFQKEMIAQGFNGIEWIYLSKEKDKKFTNRLYEYVDLHSFEEDYYNLLMNDSFVTHYFSITNHDRKSITEILESKLKIEEKFKLNFPDQYAFLNRYALLEKEAPLLQAKISALTENLKNQQMYLSIIRTEDEANKINDFYRNEYEILPGWYKKVGHVIKVLMGKRSFRSLYDDNVKKYKE